MVLVQLSTFSYAGTIVNGNWTPTGCGQKPIAPTIKDTDIDAFNASVESINNWQLKAKTYYDCLVKEANNDSSTISLSANREQNNHRDTVEQIRETINVTEKKLDK
jgi:predicted ATP-binding protein involved in virulence